MRVDKFLAIMTVLTVLCGATSVTPQSINSQYISYIERYCELAQKQQEQHGIPASITLAQGLLESRAGQSTLATQGNNHFGIKCHNSWEGATMLRDDDAPDECFRVYDTVEESYIDHSLFLHRKRYQRLFDLDPTDYAAWALGLRECGYATDPNYGAKLISIIERYHLYEYDLGGGKKSESDAEYILAELKESHAVRRARGLYYVIATPGDTYASIAKELGVDASKLALYNDASDNINGEIRAWEEVYLQPKLDKAPNGIKKVTIGADESARSVAQRYGVTMQLINKLNPDYADRPGTTLRLK